MSIQYNLQKPKRFKQALTLAQKINILDCLRDGMGATAVGRLYGINESSVRFIRKNEEKIRHSMMGLINGNSEEPNSMPVSRNSTLVKAEEELGAWMASMAEHKVPLSAKDIREKAKEMYQNIRTSSSNPYLVPDFVASKTWYTRFMRRSCQLSWSPKPTEVMDDAQMNETGNSYYEGEAFYPDINYQYERLSPGTSAYQAMSSPDVSHSEFTSDINGNTNSKYMATSDPEVILLDCDDDENENKPPTNSPQVKPEIQSSITLVPMTDLQSIPADGNALQQFEVLQDKGVEMETNEQSTQISENSTSNVDEASAELQNRLQQEIESHDKMREECETISQESERIQEINRTLSKKLESREDEIIRLKALLNHKDQQIKRQRSQFDDTLKNLSAANKIKSSLTNRISEQDKKIARLELHNQHSISTISPARQQSREELKIVRDALHSLRNSFQSNNPQQHTIDTIEQSFATLMERLHTLESQMHSIQPTNSSETNSVLPGSLLNYDSTGDPRRSPITKLQGTKNDRSFSSVEGSEGWTKVLYYTERSVTPYLFHIPKRIGEITLKDFKDSFDRPGLYRFHFKTIDPEFGMVKEEVVHDDDIIPGLEGKVIAWIEEDV